MSYLPRRSGRNICFLRVVGDHRGVAGADKHRGAGLYQTAPRRRMHYPVEGVQCCHDGELPGPLPLTPGAPSEGRGVGRLASGK